jgi:hypothetical protein
MQKSRLVWDSLRKAVQSQLVSLEKEIIETVKAHNADEATEDRFDESATANAVRQLHTILDGLDTRLIDKLDEALNAKGDRVRELHAEAAGIVREYQAFVAGSTLIAAIDANGFVPTSIRATVEKTLSGLARSL